jgi:hypothetical protein
MCHLELSLHYSTRNMKSLKQKVVFYNMKIYEYRILMIYAVFRNLHLYSIYNKILFRPFQWPSVQSHKIHILLLYKILSLFTNLPPAISRSLDPSHIHTQLQCTFT